MFITVLLSIKGKCLQTNTSSLKEYKSFFFVHLVLGKAFYASEVGHIKIARSVHQSVGPGYLQTDSIKTLKLYGLGS